MHSKLPNPDLDITFDKPKFKAFLAPFEPAIFKWKQASPEVKLVVKVKAAVQGSDIKWNDFAGKLTGSVVDNAGTELCSLFSCQLIHFTGNCGVKSIDHLEIGRIPGIPAAKSGLEETCKGILSLIESFAFHKTNCGILVGSDTNCGSVGNTLTNVQKFGNGYTITPSTWNPNYTWSKNHQISLFWKDLNASAHENYWE